MTKSDTTAGSLVAMYKRGELALPEMQRAFVWGAPRVRDLMDSLYRGYPSGVILVWEAFDERRRSSALQTNGDNARYLLLDGQQRITSLSAILTGQPVSVKGRKGQIRLLFNLDHPDTVLGEDVDEDAETTPEEGADADPVMERVKNRTFVVRTNRLAASKRWVDVSEVLTKKLNEFEHVEEAYGSLSVPGARRALERLQKLRQVIDYPYVMQILDGSMSYEEVTEVFVRVNSKGAKLRASDLAYAQVTSRWPGFLGILEQAEADFSGTFPVSKPSLLRTLVALTSGGCKFSRIGGIPASTLHEGWERVISSLDWATGFLRTNLGMDDERLLGSPFALVALAAYRDRQPDAFSTQETARLKRWTLLAGALGHYSGSSETKLDADLKVIQSGEGADGLLRLLGREGNAELMTSDSFMGRNQQNPLLNLVFLALRKRGARDWKSGIGIRFNNPGNLTLDIHHIHPKATLKGHTPAEEVDEIANLAFIQTDTNKRIAARSPQSYLPEFLSKQTMMLREHALPEDPELWKTENFSAFLIERRRLLAEAVNELIGGA